MHSPPLPSSSVAQAPLSPREEMVNVAAGVSPAVRIGGEALFEVDGVTGGRLLLEDVYFNGIHALKRLEFRNISRDTLRIRLQSNLGQQIAFQLSNENLPEVSGKFAADATATPSLSKKATPEADTSYTLSSRLSTTSLASSESIVDVDVNTSGTEQLLSPRLHLQPGAATNTAAAAAMNASADASSAAASTAFHYNELFNFVNHIDHIVLAPHEAKSIILAFLPAKKEPTTPSSVDDRKSLPATDVEVHETFEVSGLLFFTAHIMESSFFDSSRDGFGASTTVATPKTRTRPGSIALSSSETTAAGGTFSGSDVAGIATGSSQHAFLGRTGEAPGDSNTVVIKFRSKVCKSVLWSNVSDTGISFEDCVVGVTYVKDFTVWNRSEIPLYFLITINGLADSMYENWFKLTDYDTGEPLDGKPIPSFSHRRIRLTMVASEPAEISTELQIENVNDPNNMETITLQTTVRSVQQEESLLITSGSVVDFGDCYAGNWNKQQITVKNVADSPLEIYFSSDLPGVAFDLKTDPLMMSPTTEKMHESRVVPKSEFPDQQPPSGDSPATSTVSSQATSPSLTRSRGSRATSSLDFIEQVGLQRADSAGSVRPNTATADLASRLMEPQAIRIEELTLQPGSERTVEINFRSDDNGTNRTSLEKIAFKVNLAYSFVAENVRRNKKIKCKARIASSQIEVTPKELNFGDVDVGTLKSLPIRITNLSDLMASVELRFDSKILNCSRWQITIAPRQYQEVKVDIYPRKVNPEYRKQIAVVNLFNRDNDQTIELRSNNIDKNRVTFHSLFYRVLTPNSTNFVDYGTAILNNSTVRTFTIENISKKMLRLGITSSLPEEMQVFTITKSERTFASAEGPPYSGLAASSRNEPLPTVEPASFIANGASQTSSTDYLDLASSIQATSRDTRGSPARPASRSKHSQRTLVKSGQRVKQGTQTDLFSQPVIVPPLDTQSDATEPDVLDHTRSLEPSRMNESAHKFGYSQILALLNSLEAGSKHAMVFGKHATEERFLKSHLALLKSLAQIQKEGKLAPISSVNIEPDSSEVIVLVLTPSGKNRPYIQGRPKKQDAKVYLRLLEFDRESEQAPEFANLISAPPEQIPVRELIIRTALCRSVMEIGQKHINFGLMEKRERRYKTILIYNRSEVPLLYSIRKTGSIASGDLSFEEGRIGVVRPQGKREVMFSFNPSMPGNFFEKIAVENLQDRENDQTVGVKAQIRKPSNFFIKSLEMNFGAFLVNESTPAMQQVLVTNTSKQARTLELRVDTKDLVFANCFGEMFFDISSDAGGDQSWSKEVQEQIEHLEQKLKVAVRKAQQDKVKKITDKLEKLRGPASASKPAMVEEPRSAAFEPLSSSDMVRRPSSSNGPRKLRTTDDGVVVNLEPQFTISIGVYLRIVADPGISGQRTEICKGEILVNELRNTDSVKRIQFQIIACFDYAAYIQALEGNQTDFRSLSNEAIPLSRPVSPKLSRNASLQQIEQPPFAALAPVDIKVLDVQPQLLDLGKIELATSSSYYLTLNNPCETLVDFFVRISSDSRIILKASPRGRLKPLESRRIYFSLRPSDFGRQTDCLTIVDRTHRVELDFTVTYHALQDRYLQFEGLSVAGEIDFGACYVDPSKKYCKSIGIEVRNVSLEPISVAIRSNLVQQIYLFSDRELTDPLSCMKLDVGGAKWVYVALQPNIASSSLKNGDCRELVGGLKFAVSLWKREEATDGEVLVSQTIRFVALIGESLIETSMGEFDFGVSTTLDSFEGSFVISNPSQRLPLEVEIQCPDSITISEQSLSLHGAEMKSASRIKVDFVFSPKSWGYFEEQIKLLNLHNSAQACVITLRVYIDPGLLIIRPHKKKHNLFATTEYVQYAWEYLYLDKPENPSLVLTGVNYDKAIEIVNASERQLDFEAWADFPVEITSHGANDPAEADRLHPKICATPGESIFLHVRPKTPSELGAAEIARLYAGSVVVRTGMIRLVEESTNSTIGVFKISAHYFFSKGMIEPAQIDLGRMGLTGRLADVPFSFSVKNCTDAPLLYEIPDGEAISVTAVTHQGVPRDITKKQMSIPARDSVCVDALLNPRKLNFISSASQVFTFPIANVCNPNDRLAISFKASVSECQLKFGRLVSGELLLPPLIFPQPLEATPCDSWFSVTNISAEDAKFEATLELAPELNDILSVEILSRFSNSKLKGLVTLPPQGSLEIKVRAAIKADSKRLSEISQNITNPDGLTFGRLQISVRLPESDDISVRDDIPLRGTLIEGPSFAISKRRLDFRCTPDAGSDHETDDEGEMPRKKDSLDHADTPVNARTSDTVHITNLSHSYSLVFKVALEVPESFRSNCIQISAVDKDGIGSVAPGSTLSLVVELVGAIPVGAIDVKLHIQDMNSIARRTETVVISIISEMRQWHPILDSVGEPSSDVDPLLESDGETLTTPSRVKFLAAESPAADWERTTTAASAALSDVPVFSIRGCKKISGDLPRDNESLRYEMDVGQQDVSVGSIIRKISLVNESPRVCRFRVRSTVVNEMDVPWLSVSKLEGTLEATPSQSEHESHICQFILTLSCKKPGQFCGYLFVDNLDNAADTKLVRVTMEHVPVALEKSTGTRPLFDVTVDGLDRLADNIVVENVLYNVEYVDRSIIVYNNESVPLEFTVKHDIPDDSRSELLFSLHQAYACLFRSLTIEAHSSARIYLRLCVDSSEMSSTSDERIRLHSFKIFINCRQVKDFQKTISLSALCRKNSLQLSTDELFFQGRYGKSGPTDVSIQCENDGFQVVNYCDHSVPLVVMNDCRFFLVNQLAVTVEPGQTADFRVSINQEEVQKNLVRIRKNKYFEEVITVYNQLDSVEKFRVVLRLSFGKGSSHYNIIPTSKSFVAYLALESRIIQFLRDVGVNWGILAIKATQATDYEVQSVLFHFTYIVDQLIYMSTKENVGENFLHLATLLFLILLEGERCKNIDSALWKDDKSAIRIFMNGLQAYLLVCPQKSAYLDQLRTLYRNYQVKL